MSGKALFSVPFHPELDMGILKVSSMQLFGLVVFCCSLARPVSAANRTYNFIIREEEYTRLCNTTTILTVNGQFLGPTIYASKGDTVIVNVLNIGHMNITIHWHGVANPRNPWSDGPEYITQCPIQPGASFTQTVLLSHEEGTIWWHAHSDFSRATVHGAIVIYPAFPSTYPFPTPQREFIIVLGEWWIAGANRVLQQGLSSGADFNASDAYTINGQPGDLYPCSNKSTYKIHVEQGKTYLLRVVNCVLNEEMFFAVAGHQLTLVGTDAAYTKPYTVDYVMIMPGQTMDFLLNASQPVNIPGTNTTYYMAARAFTSNPGPVFDPTTTTAILQYITRSPINKPPQFPNLPPYNDTNASTNFTAGLRSLASDAHPADVPQTIDQRIIMTVSVNVMACASVAECPALHGLQIAASLNNISFEHPTLDILEAYVQNKSGVFGTDFPSQPPFVFNYTGDNLPFSLGFTSKGTEVRVIEYNSSVEIVFQDTNVLNGHENHPMHMHGFSFYTVGSGFGNFNETTDPPNYNLVDPPQQNTVGLPDNGWVAIRFTANNPGVWLMHCHLERHTVWGMDTTLIVKNGPTPDSQMLPQPPDMPPC